ncbi:MAG: MaoC family dehydratase, partial [Pseudomonadota bacterium]
MSDRPVRAFEDLEVGERRVSSAYQVTQEEILDFAQKYDPQWFHADAEAAKGSTFQGLIASGVHTTALWRRLDHEINSDVDFICGVGWDEVRWPNPVRPGDTLRATSEILELRPSEASADRGIAIFGYEVRNQNDEIVLSFRSINQELRAVGLTEA